VKKFCRIVIGIFSVLRFKTDILFFPTWAGQTLRLGTHQNRLAYNSSYLVHNFA